MNMTFKDAVQIADQCELYVQAVVMFLTEKIGEQAAAARVVERLILVLQAMFEGTRPDDMALALVPKPRV